MNDAARPRRMEAGADESSVALELHKDLPEELEIGRGQFLVVSGECRAPGDVVAAAAIEVDGEASEVELSRTPGGAAFWQAVFLPGDLIGRVVQVDIVLRLKSGREIRRFAGAVSCRDVDWRPAAAPGPLGGSDLIAVCMATYEPQLDAFQRQVGSIRNQTHTNWICIINDDGSRADTWARMKQCCAGDERFVFHQNDENVGFYRNFENALKKVPREAEYVAFSDQDDFWYADKLSRLLEAARRENANLVYSDMRIVDAEGTELAGTYWVNRRNEYRDLKVVLVANTVTGAASLFKRDILPYLVPFPPRVGDSFHDHWLACTALSTGNLTYVDAPLYDYYQYGSSVIGHCDFTRFTLRQRIVSLLRLCVRLCRPSVAGPLLRGKYASALAVYRGECRRLRLTQETIRKRCRVERDRDRDLHLFDGGARSVLKLLGLHAQVLVKGQTTDDAELRLAMGEAARIVERHRS